MKKQIVYVVFYLLLYSIVILPVYLIEPEVQGTPSVYSFRSELIIRLVLIILFLGWSYTSHKIASYFSNGYS